MSERPLTAFAVLLRRLRDDARLSQEDLAHAAGLHPRAVSDLERGRVGKPRRDTVELLADALHLEGEGRAEFKTAAWGRLGASGEDPKSWLNRVTAALDEVGVAAAHRVVAQWRRNGRADDAWPAWAQRCIELTAQGRMRPGAHRPLPVVGDDPLLGRDHQISELGSFLRRVEQGRGGAALVTGQAGIGKSHLIGKVIAGQRSSFRTEWVTFERHEAGYRGWCRLLAPAWIDFRRTELPPAALLAHAQLLDDILLGADERDATGPRLRGDVAEAVATLLIHFAARQPVILVIDDAHRGGASSDHLLLDVARRVSAGAVGIVVAARPDELEDSSPIRPYCQEASDRAAPDVVITVRVPPLDAQATASFIGQRTGYSPPADIVTDVLRRTGGLPHLIKHTSIQAPLSGASGDWAVGQLGAEGLLVLESTVRSRPETVRDVLQAAALCAAGGYIAPDFLARVTGVAVGDVERMLDDERQSNAILTPHIAGYRFQHDNWIDVLTRMCPPGRRRSLHAMCLSLLRDDPAADVRRLAYHAIGAGPGLVGQHDLASITTQAADQSFADYAFARASELYEIAEQHSAGADRIALLIRRAESLRFGGDWDQARAALKAAVALARSLHAVAYEAKALIHLERLTWSYGLNETELTQRLRDVLHQLPAEEAVLRLRTQAALANRLSIAARDYDNEAADLALSVLGSISAVTDPLALADCLLGVRAGLQDRVPPEDLLGYAEQIAEIGTKMRSGLHVEEGLSQLLIDLIRCGRLAEATRVVRDHRHFADQSGAAVPSYSQALFEGMLALAQGEFDEAARQGDIAGLMSSAWGGSMAGEALMAQAGWRLYETGELDGLAEFLTSLPSQDISAFNGPLWSLGAGLIHAEQGNSAAAAHALREVCSATADLANLPRGQARIATLATAAMVLGHPILADTMPLAEAARIGTGLARLLDDHQDVLVLAGWPAVILGSKHRFIGLAHLAAGNQAAAAEHLARAAQENQDLKVLHARTQFDLARALLRQPGTRAAGVTEMAEAKNLAAELKLTTLVAQADAELARGLGAEPSAEGLPAVTAQYRQHGQRGRVGGLGQGESEGGGGGAGGE